MILKSGLRLQSAVCDAQVIAVRAPAGVEVDLRCGGVPLVAMGDAGAGQSAISADHSAGTLMGKRYADDELGVEILCTKPGTGSLSVGETALLEKGAKPLPSSD